jgi:predicted nucleic acid-binding protein
MAWVVDTCILIDILENDPAFGLASALTLKRLLPEGLVASPVTLVELSPAFNGEWSQEQRFLELVGVAYGEKFELADVRAAHGAWAAYVAARRQHREPRRPVADVLIGGFAMRFQGLVTRNANDFTRWFPDLRCLHPRNP